jgi:GTP-binding protein HflX
MMDINNLVDTGNPEGKQPVRTMLISAYKGTGPSARELCREHVDELELLAETYGLDVVHKVSCLIRRYDAATHLTEGKLDEFVALAKEHDAKLVIFDDEISPAQQRNLEKAFGIAVIDRTEIILGVFGQRAQTKEARLQIELAQVRYEAPRLKRLWTHLSRQHGSGGSGSGGGYLKGEGEKQLEIDKRILKKKIDQLQQELDEVRSHRVTQRTSRQRAEIPVFAFIGYTNVGKSTLLNTLTDAGVFVENKLFATLDTTTRKFTLPNNQEILLTDTVGFIRKLPHLLVAAFKSTLEEAFQADILLHVVDTSHHMAEEQAETTFEVLKELKAENKPIITVFNKIDLCADLELLNRLKNRYPRSVQISAITKQGIDDLLAIMIEELSKQRRIINLRIPQSEYGAVSEVMRHGTVINQEYEENDVILNVELPAMIAEKMKRFVWEP